MPTPAPIELAKRRCQACTSSTPRLKKAQIGLLLPELKNWKIIKATLTKSFKFKNFHETMAFVNAVAWIANTEDHHPDLEVGYAQCKVHYSTHAVKGLSENDFICAAKIDALFPQ